MQCPLCRESVADDNALQVHYLMSCRGYLESSTSKQNEAPPSKKLVQFRWIKSKPTLAREVYLISSLAGSVKLVWRILDECFLSDQVEVPQGLHVCQLVVDGDAMSTHDFTVSDTSRTIDIMISEVPEDPIGDVSEGENEDVETQPVPRPEHRDEQDGGSEVTTQKLPEKGSLYRELLDHQIVHGDSLETLTAGSSGVAGRSREGKRTRGNGVATRAIQSQRNTEDKDLTRITRTDDDDRTTRTKRNISDRQSQRQNNDGLRDSLSSDELQQFLQPTRTRQESNGDVGEDRESSASDNEEHSLSLSSHEGFERRPELLGQSNGENESRVQPDTADQRITDQVPDAGSQTGTHQESVSGHRLEARLIDLSEPSSVIDRKASSKDRNPSGDDRDRPSNDQEGIPKADARLLLDSDRRESFSSLREESTGNDRRRPSDESQERPSSCRHKQSSGVLREQTLGDGRERLEDDREPTEGNRETLESHREDLINNRKPSEDTRDRSQNNSEILNSDREQSSNLRTEASGHRREETSSGLQEKSGADPKSFDRQERTGRRERTSGNDRTKTTYREGISETQNNNSSRYDRTSFLNDSDFTSLPATFTSEHTTPRSTVQSGVYSGDLISLRGSDTLLTDNHGLDSQTRGRISPRSSATTVTSSRGLDTGITLTGGRRLEDTTTGTTADDLLFRNHSSSGLRTNTVLGKDTGTQRKDFIAHRSHSTPTCVTSTRSTDIPESKDTPQTEDISTTRDIPPTSNIPPNTETPQLRDVTALSRDVSTFSSVTLHDREFHPSKDITSQSRDSRQSRAITPQNEESHQSRDITVPRTDTSTSTRDRNPSSKDSRSEQIPSNIPEDDNTSTRRTPQGSIVNSDIRRPPLYTSAPSRPRSSLRYTSHTAISPLSSPRDGLSTENLGTSATTQSRVDRVAPAGSTVSPEGPQFVPSTTTAKQFSEDQVKELLENIRKGSAAKPGGSPESISRERSGASEINSLKEKLVERDEKVKNLTEKNARYKASNDRLREEVIELTKNLSLAEASKDALKDQEEISSELENALGEKELECAQLKEQVFEVEREQRRMTVKYDQEKKDYEKKINELRKISKSLEQEVKTLREMSSTRNRSPISSREYKKMLEGFQESQAVSASLKDQVKTLEQENKDLKEKLRTLSPRSRQENVTSYTSDVYSSRSEVGTRRQDYSSVNGYPDTDTFRHRTENDRDRTSNVRLPYDGHQPVIEHASRTNRSRQQSEITRNRLDLENFPSRHEGLQDRLGSPRYRSDIFGSERYEMPPRAEISRSRESRSRQRFTTADDDTLGISDPDYTRVLHRRSHSSDAIRNAFPDGSRSRISPSQERESQEFDRRSKRESRPHHSGSSDNLYARPASSSPTRDLTLTGYGVGHTPTSPEETSLRSKRRSSPQKSSPFAPETAQQIDVGMTVLVTRHRGTLSRGVVRYVGYLPSKEDKVYVGLEVNDGDGKHDGKFNGQRFFKCPANRGVFVPFEKIVMAYT